MSMKKKQKTGVGNHSNFVFDTLKLLVLQDDVQKEIADLRIYAGVDVEKFEREADFQKWYDILLDEYAEKGADSRYGKLQASIKEVMKKNCLTEDFYNPLWHYILFNKVWALQIGNYKIGWKPKLEDDETFIASIKIHRRLSDKELDGVKNTLKFLQEAYLPAHRKIPTSPIKEIDKKIEAFAMMQEKGVHKQKIYKGQYLDILKKQRVNGTELLAIEKLHRESIEVKKRKVTSKTVAKKIFGTASAADRVRTTNTRIRKMIRERFKKM